MFQLLTNVSHAHLCRFDRPSKLAILVFDERKVGIFYGSLPRISATVSTKWTLVTYRLLSDLVGVIYL